MFDDEVDPAEFPNSEVRWYDGEYSVMTAEEAAAARASHNCRHRRC